MTTKSWLTPDDIAGDEKGPSGRPISPAPLMDGDPSKAASIKVEFPDGAPGVTMNRRDFVRISGTATAAAGLTATAGCKIPTETIVPYANRDGSIIAGKANFYATTIAGAPARVKTRAGKPIHIEGNGSVPGSVDGTSARTGAAILDLYDPDRGTGPMRLKAGKAKATDWASLDKAVVDAARASGPKTRMLTGPISGHATREAIAEFLGGIGGGSPITDLHVAWTPDGYDALRQASALLFGVAGVPDYRLADAKTIVSFGADFLDTFISPERFSSDWAKSRNVEAHGQKISSTIVFEASLSMTGGNADRRFRVRSSEMVNVAGTIARFVAEQRQASPEIIAHLKGFDPAAVASQVGVSADDLRLVAERLVATAGSSVVFGGGTAGNQALESMALLINHLLGNIGKTVLPGGSQRGAAGFSGILRLIDDINKGRVQTLIIANTNPIHLAAALGMESALSKVKTIVYVGDRIDETGLKAHWFAPASHDLEAWGDSSTETGIHSIQQPSIRPLKDSRGLLDHLIAWSNLKDTNGRITWTMGGRLHTARTQASKAAKAGETPSPAYYYIRESWNAAFFRQGTDAGKQQAFNEALRTGYFHDTKATAPSTSLNMGFLRTLPRQAVDASASWDVLLNSSVAFGGGEGVQPNNGWLQELADPITHVVWDTVARVSPRDARTLGLKDGDSIQVSVGDAAVIAPVIAQPGLAAKTVVLPVGLGRTAVGAVGNGVGLNAYTLMTNNGHRIQTGDVVGAQGWTQIARIGGDDSRDGRGKDLRNDLINNALRPLCPEASLGEWTKKNKAAHGKHGADHGAKDHHGHGGEKHYNHQYGGALYEPHGEHKTFVGGHPGPSHWSGHEYTGYRWAMTIDTNTCTGCNACVIACQSENNVAVVGKKGVLSNREMSWLRIDRYYAFDRQADNVNAAAEHQDWDHLAPTPEGALDNPKVHFQPMLCQHCENAGCESVCPFTATMHDEEGVNQQAYNRCVGTRYCANNCAYKVRRYNWFEYSYERTNWLATTVNTESKNHARYNTAGDLNSRYNPEVTVRTRGVMEKCSFCAHRVQAAKHHAESEHRPVADDGELQTACQAACPANSISFGDINNPKTTVSQQVAGIRSYRILEDIGAKPSVFYLTRIWNA